MKLVFSGPNLSMFSKNKEIVVISSFETLHTSTLATVGVNYPKYLNMSSLESSLLLSWVQRPLVDIP